MHKYTVFQTDTCTHTPEATMYPNRHILGGPHLLDVHEVVHLIAGLRSV